MFYGQLITFFPVQTAQTKQQQHVHNLCSVSFCQANSVSFCHL